MPPVSVSSMNDRLRRSRLAQIAASCAVGITALTYACGGGGSDAPTEPPAPPAQPQAPSGPPADLSTLKIIAGAGQTDTISAILPQPLMVEVHDSTGAVAAGRPVRFTAFDNLDVAPLGLQN